jgi:hypothetical protein
LGSPVQVEFLKKTFLTEEFQMKAFVSSLAALFLAAGVIGCGDGGSADTDGGTPPTTADHDAMSSGSAPDGHGADDAPAEGEGDAAPAEGEGDAAPAEGDAAAPTEGDAPAETEAAAPAEGEGDAAPAEGDKAE